MAEAAVASLVAVKDRLEAEISALRGQNARLLADAAEADIALADARARYSSLEVSTGRLMDHHLAYKMGIEAALARMGSAFVDLKEAAGVAVDAERPGASGAPLELEL